MISRVHKTLSALYQWLLIAIRVSGETLLALQVDVPVDQEHIL